ncbi:hypothetical protein QQ020_30140 [Fulvivirgaceae bacterium BMA12]|uniref:Uncharacterized protein n=1 Tax=Agaribacillus aureus TaxID=3051825 RepID=A0ABT8LF24_9BACT|nr:hypothetical protein [Fulvivirgaceae bacterium BMA12]
MAKFLNHIKALFTISLIVIISVGGALAVDTGTDGKNTEVKRVKPITPISENKNGKISEKSLFKTDSLKSSEKVVEGKKTTTPTKVKKPDNTSQSAISYNFLFYLMYKFKIADILNISKEKDAINIPGNSSIISNGKRLADRIINRLLY